LAFDARVRARALNRQHNFATRRLASANVRIPRAGFAIATQFTVQVDDARARVRAARVNSNDKCSLTTDG